MQRSHGKPAHPAEPAQHKWYSSFIAGGAAGFVSSVATCPLDVIKTRLQAQRTHHAGDGYLGVSGTHRCALHVGRPTNSCAGTVKQVFMRDGLKGFYRGLGPTLLGYLPTWAIYFSVYDGIKDYFGEVPLAEFEAANQRRNHSIYPAPQAKGYQPAFREGSWTLHIFSSVGAGMTSTLCTNPLWVIKTRFMVRLALCYASLAQVLHRHSPLARRNTSTRWTHSSPSTAPRAGARSTAVSHPVCSEYHTLSCSSRSTRS